MNMLKTLIRKVLSVVMYYGWYSIFRSWDRNRKGEPLIEGITAVVSARNEEFTLPLCLKSLIGVVDQVVCIDNGSDDRTLEIMKKFKSENEGSIEVDILEMPGALLGDCRNAGLDHTRYKWHLRWDADMVCRTTGDESMILLRDVIKDDRPRTIQLPRTNLRGDFHHTRKELAIDPGEPILVRFGAHIKYVEYGKFDVIRVPFYYTMVKESKRYYFHLEGLKSDDSMVYRRQYFEWRELFNSYSDNNRPESVSDFENYKREWCLREFETADRKELKWRFNRLNCHMLSPVNKVEFGEYPKVLVDEMNQKDQQYRIVMKDDKPYTRTDLEDAEMLNYEPSADDLAWEKKHLG